MRRPSKDQIRLEKKAILRLLESAGRPLTRRRLAEQLAKEGQPLPDRTLQRRLEDLVSESEVSTEGTGKATTYRFTTVPDADPKSYPPISRESEKILSILRSPVNTRTPVGYDREWLYEYETGKTWYLPLETRQHLLDLGRTSDEHRAAGTFARDILGRLLIDLSWASSRLEGNTYSRLDTQNLLEFGQVAAGKDAQETQMILNHKAAIEQLVAADEMTGLNRMTITGLHAALSENLLSDASQEGRLRERPVSITNSTFVPTAIPQVIQECFDRILFTASEIEDPFEQSFFVMVHIPYLQPFADVNKRTSRLAANIPFIQRNLSPLSFVDVPEKAYIDGTLAIYEQKRIELLRDVYVFAYERSSAQYRVIRESLGQPDPIRLRFRDQMATIVVETVRNLQTPTAIATKDRAASLGIPAEQADAFAEAAMNVLLNLNEASALRYRLRPSEFLAWKALFRPSAG